MTTAGEVDTRVLARAVADKCWEWAERMREKAIRAEARWAKITLLEIVDQHPDVTSFGWTLEYAYDAGIFFEVASGSCDGADEASDEVADLGLSPDVVRTLCTVTSTQSTVDDNDTHELTVAELRERTFVE